LVSEDPVLEGPQAEDVLAGLGNLTRAVRIRLLALADTHGEMTLDRR
jgi:hypothetical protein